MVLSQRTNQMHDRNCSKCNQDQSHKTHDSLHEPIFLQIKEAARLFCREADSLQASPAEIVAAFVFSGPWSVKDIEKATITLANVVKARS
jgi:hypothetical protein